LKFLFSPQRLLASTAILAILSVGAASAQSDSAAISGTVTDASGAVLPNVTVTVRNEANGVTNVVRSNAAGEYTVPNVAPGNYTVKVEAHGFATFSTTHVAVDASIARKVDASLKVGSSTDVVTVTADSNTVQTESAVLGQLVTAEQVKSIQLNGRDPLYLAQMEPGVVRTAPMASFAFSLDNGIEIGGGRSQEALITLDGAPMVRTRSNGDSVGVADVDATAQVQVLTSAYPAEYGRSNSGQVRIVPKSGTSTFHATAYEYLRNNFFNANTWQRKLPGNSAQIRDHPQSFRFNQYGWNLNGPGYIPGHWNKAKQKLFFLAGQEYIHYIVDETVFQTVPSLAMRAGDFSELLGPGATLYGYTPGQEICVPGTGQTGQPACDQYPNNVIPTASLSPNGTAIMKVFPQPNATGSTTYNWVNEAANIQTQRKDTLVIDYVPTEAQRLRFTLLNFAFKQTAPHNGNFNLLPQKWNRPNQVAVLHHTWNISPTMVNEAVASAASDHVTIGVDTSSGLYDRTKYGVDYPYLYPASTKTLPLKYPTVQLAGSFTLLDGTPYPSRSGGIVFTYGDTLLKVWGNHTAKFGISAEYAGENNFDQITVSNTPGSTNNQNGRFNFTDTTLTNTTGVGAANAALGMFDTYAEIGQRSYTLYRAWAYDAFAQDTWHVTPHIVLEYGLHYSYYNPYYAKWGNQSVFSPKDYDPALAATVDPTNGQVTGTPQQLYNGAVIPGSGFPSSAQGHVSADILSNYAFLFRGYDRQYSPTIKTNIQPRVGITYQLRPGTVIRAGGGRYIQRLGITDNVFTGGNAPFQPSEAVSNGLVDNPAGAGLSPNYTQIYSSQAYHYPSPEAYNWNLTVEQELKSLGVMTLSYAGRRGLHEEELVNLNQLQPGTTFANPGINENYLRPYKGYYTINQATNEGASIYHSLQANLRRRMTRGLTFGVAYTWSKSLDFGSSNGTKLPNTFNQNLMWGRSDFDVRHVFLANVVYDIDRFNHASNFLVRGALGHWQASGTLQGQTGTGLSVTTSTDFAGVGTGSGSQFVPMLHKSTTPKKFAGQTGTAKWFDPTAFVQSNAVLTSATGPYRGTFTSRGARNVISGPGFQSYNMALNKSWVIVPAHENTLLTFRAEAFNLANHPTPDNPNTTFTSAQFGESQTKGGTYGADRQFQFSLRLAF
jgi:hypothetical protein